MNRQNLRDLAALRRRESAALLRAGLYPGAYYLIGYAVECALKACVARQTKRYDFPNKQVVSKVFTHDLQQLVKLAGLESDLIRDTQANPAFQLNWAIAKDWSEEVRYDLSITRAQAKDLYSACTSRKTGVLTWVRQRW